MYNPIQQRMDSLDTQIAMLQQQRQMLQPMVQPTPPVQTNRYDFNGLWCNGYDEAKQISNDNLPLIIFDRKCDRFYMKQLDGSTKAFEFHEVQVTQEENDALAGLKQAIEQINNDLQELKGKMTNEQSISNNEESIAVSNEPVKTKKS